MAEVNGIGSELLGIYNSLIGTLPNWAQSFVNLFLLVILVVLYAVFVWKLYRFISKKNPLGLNLSRFNRSENPFTTKLFAGLLYFIEYIIVLPFLIFFWFAIFTLFLITLTQNQNISQILIISATIIAAVRMISYYSEGLADEVAKFLPLTILAVAIINPEFFQAGFIERVINMLAQIPSYFAQITHYLGFIIILEIILRFFDFVFSLFGLEEEVEEK